MLLAVRWRNQPLRVGRRRKQRFLINGFNAYSTPVRTLKRFKIKKRKEEKEKDLRSFAFGLLGFLFCCCCFGGRFVVFLGAADRFRGPLPCHPSKLCKTACRLISSVSRVISWRNSSQNPSPILTDGWLFSTQPVLDIEDLIFGESIPLRLVGPVILHDRWGGLEEGGSVCRTWHVTLLVKWSRGVGGAWTSVAWGKGTASVPSVSVPFTDPGRFCFCSSHICNSHVTAIAISSFLAKFVFVVVFA